MITVNVLRVGSKFEQSAGPVSFRHLVSAMRGGTLAYRPAIGATHEGVFRREVTHDGEDVMWSLHFAAANPPRKARYWRLAMRAAGLLDGKVA